RRTPPGFVLFCFSSRRRHTRSTRDWSSDVCSSDLSKISVDQFEFEVETGGVIHTVRLDGVSEKSYRRIIETLSTQVKKRVTGRRSEERRVGKEGRYW